MNDDAQSGIHFIAHRGSSKRKKEDRNSMGSSNSMASLQQTPMNRTNSVTSMLKRLFSKEDQRQQPTSVTNQTDSGAYISTFIFYIISTLHHHTITYLH